MPSDVPLQLFPAPPAKAAKPKRKGSRRKAHPHAATVLERAKSPTALEEIVIQVTERREPSAPAQAADSTAAPPDPPRSTTTPAGSPPPTTSASRAASPALTNNRSEAAVPSNPLRPRLPKSRAASPAFADSPPTAPAGATLVRSNSDVTTEKGARRDAAGIRSIFPRYNPALPLERQIYRPTQATSPAVAPQHISKEPYSPSLFSAGSPGRQSPGRACLSAPSAVASFPSGVLGENHRPRFSSLDELVDLWEAANGQVTPETGRQFALKMHREGASDRRTRSFVPTASESFTFGPTREQPFFDFQTLKPSDSADADEGWECHVRRRDPRKGTVIPVMSLDLAPPKRRAPGGDGLVTNIYPKIAAMMALDNARTKTEAQQLSADEAETVRQDAVRRAARFESSTLSWDHDSGRYYLMHPGLNKGKGQRFVVLADPGVGFDVPDVRGTIRLVEAAAASSSGAASTSTAISSCDTLAAIEFGTSSLIIDTSATAKLPSFYMVDICVSALITVALIEGRKTRAALRAKALNAPVPISPPPPALTKGSPAAGGLSSHPPHPGAAAGVAGRGHVAGRPFNGSLYDEEKALAGTAPAGANGGTHDALKQPRSIAGAVTLVFEGILWVLGAIAAGIVALATSFRGRTTAAAENKTREEEPPI